jgi:hypothetical protein
MAETIDVARKTPDRIVNATHAKTQSATFSQVIVSV